MAFQVSIVFYADNWIGCGYRCLAWCRTKKFDRQISAHSQSGFRLFGERMVLIIKNCIPEKSYSNAPAAPQLLDSAACGCMSKNSCACPIWSGIAGSYAERLMPYRVSLLYLSPRKEICGANLHAPSRRLGGLRGIVVLALLFRYRKFSSG